LKRFAQWAEQLNEKERWSLLRKITWRKFYPKRTGQAARQALTGGHWQFWG
jgi:hypothetical protein